MIKKNPAIPCRLRSKSDEYCRHRISVYRVPASGSAAQFIKFPKEMMVEGERILESYLELLLAERTDDSHKGQL